MTTSAVHLPLPADPVSPSPRQHPSVTTPIPEPERLGQYRMMAKIARGGSGDVYRAVSDDGEMVAIKVLSFAAAEDETRLLRFYQEANSLLQISNKNLVRAIEVGEEQGRHYLVMELVEGQSLAEHVMEAGQMTEAAALRVVISIARGLQAAHHQGIVHRDVSPKNIMLSKDGQAKLGDFEFSKQTEMDLDLTVQGTGLGTPDFMSPEQFRKAKDVDHTTDIYSLGACLYVMLTARLPFPGQTLVDKWLAKHKNHFLPAQVLNESLCRGTVSIINRSMAADPSKRPASAAEFADLAQRCLDSLEFQYSQRGSNAVQSEPLWSLIAITSSGQTRKARLTFSQVVELIEKQELPPDSRASLEGKSAFVPIAELPEFQPYFNATRLSKTLSRANEQVKRQSSGLLVRLGTLLQRLGQFLSQ